MPRDGVGGFTKAVSDFVYDTVISETDMNTLIDDIADEIANSVDKDGQTPWIGNMNANSNKITSLAVGSAAGDSVTVAQVQAGALIKATSVAGTVDVITANLTPSISAYPAGLLFWFISAGTNTTAVTINLNSVGALALKKKGGSALAAGDLPGAGGVVMCAYDGTDLELVNSPGALLSADIGVTVQAYDADTLKADTADVLTAGFATTIYDEGTKTTGTFTPDEANGNMQKAVNGGAHTLAPPANDCTLVIQYTNNGSAGTITTSGFTLVDGDALTTTNGDDFFFYITNIETFSHLTVKALQ